MTYNSEILYDQINSVKGQTIMAVLQPPIYKVALSLLAGMTNEIVCWA